MNRIILSVLAVGFCFAIGQALECYECKLGLGSLCITSKLTCKKGELCFSGVGLGASIIQFKTKGCLAKGECNKTSDEGFQSNDFNTSLYSIEKTCCSTDLCNEAPGLPGSSGLSLTLATATALFVANILV